MEAWPDYNLSNLDKFANSYPDPNHIPKIFFKIFKKFSVNPDHNTPTRSLPILLRLIHKNCGINVG